MFRQTNTDKLSLSQIKLTTVSRCPKRGGAAWALAHAILKNGKDTVRPSENPTQTTEPRPDNVEVFNDEEEV